MGPGQHVCVGDFKTGRISAPCVVPTKSTRGTVMRQCSDKNYRGIIWMNKRLYKFWHTGEMLSHKRLSVDQQRQKTCMRRVRNEQCAANSFIPFSVHLARRLAGEIPCLTSIPRTAICLQQLALNIARYFILQLSLLTCDIKAPFLNVISSESFKSHVIMLPRCFILRVHVRGEPFNDTARTGGSPLLPMRMHVVFLELNTTLNSSEKVSQMCKRSWSAWTKGVSNPTSSA